MSVLPPGLTITVLGRDYQFKVQQGQQAALQELAKALDEKLCSLHSQSPLTSRDQLLVLTMLNTLLELSQLQQQCLQDQHDVTSLLKQINSQLTAD